MYDKYYEDKIVRYFLADYNNIFSVMFFCYYLNFYNVNKSFGNVTRTFIRYYYVICVITIVTVSF